MSDHHDEAEAYRNAKERAEQALAERDAEIARLREALERIERFGTNWATGVDENLERVREIARLALKGKP